MTDTNKPIVANQLGKLFYLVELSGLSCVFKTSCELKGGELDIDIFKKACDIELERYPIFKSTVVERKGLFKWDLLWVSKKDYKLDDNIQVYDFSGLSYEEAERKYSSIHSDDFSWFSLTKHTPFFVAVVKFSKDVSRMIVFFHHAACDGIGCTLFLNDLFQTYNNLFRGRQPFFKQEPVFSSDLLPESFSDRVLSFWGGMKLLWKHGAVVKNKSVAKTSFKSRVFSVKRRIDSEKMKNYLFASKKNGATFTVFFTAAYIRALVKFRAVEFSDCFSVMLHRNLRKRPEDYRDVQNRFSVFHVNITIDDLKDINCLIDSIKKQSALAEKNNDAEKVISLLWLIDFLPARIFYSIWLKFLFQRPVQGNMFSISNMGRIFEEFTGKNLFSNLGDSEIQTFTLSAQPIPSVGALLALCSYRGGLFLNYDYFIDFMQKTEALKLLDIIEEGLDETAAEILKL